MPGFLPGPNRELINVCHFEPLSLSQCVMRQWVTKTQPGAEQVQLERARDFKEVSRSWILAVSLRDGVRLWSPVVLVGTV